ncbi:MAG: hypothetical protein M3483_07540 [Gemmatimonadota bacterium]|nr:hypothetical protein [Gemmatimonadota bacterium]
MDALDVLIDDYLRVIVRTRPWTRRREEEALTTLLSWVNAQPGSVKTLLVTEDVVAQCADDLDLGHEARENLQLAARNLMAWARGEGKLERNYERSLEL